MKKDVIMPWVNTDLTATVKFLMHIEDSFTMTVPDPEIDDSGIKLISGDIYWRKVS